LEAPFSKAIMCMMCCLKQISICIWQLNRVYGILKTKEKVSLIPLFKYQPIIF